MAFSDQQPLGSGLRPRSEPDEVLAGIDLTGRTAVVTGGYSGIGLETTRALASVGARVVVAGRTASKAAEALADVAGDVVFHELDLADLATVRRFADDVLAEAPVLDLLVTNAGIMAGPERRVGPGWESQFATNHLGHHALATALLPALRAAEAPRVVALSSSAHRRSGILWDDPHFHHRPYDKWLAYAQSKTADALFALALSPRLADAGGRAFSVHPGGIFTPLQRDLPIEEQIALGWRGEDGEPAPAVRTIFKSPSQGCTTTLFAATSPLLTDLHGVYCEDNDVAARVGEAAEPYLGVEAHACDEESAARLWDLSESMLAAA